MMYSKRLVVLGLAMAMTTPAQAGTESPHEQLKNDCESCHTSTTFRDVEYDHGRTDFNLEGRHAAENCLSCHDVRDFSLAKSECTSCHTDVHEAKMGLDCARCHSSASWSVFDVDDIHLSTRFPVMGRHVTVDCQSCHPTMPHGDMRATTIRCVDCHQADYLEVPSPRHVSAGFSTECLDCHQMNFWRPASMGDHDAFFPIFSGRHAGAWAECATCHTDPANNRVFNCLNCHEHNQTTMNSSHTGMPGYAWESNACLSCHPSGQAGNFLEHDLTYFPIFSGRHAGAWTDCTTCHADPVNRANFTCLSCHEHSQPVIDPVHAGMPGYAWESNTCLSCHPDGLAGQFIEHDPQFFPIYSGAHAGAWTDCSTCHTDPANRTLFSCLTCHDHSQSVVDPAHVGMPGYAWESNSCYSCHPTGLAGQYVDHDAQFFPIYSGKHSGRWKNDCATCHPNPQQKAIVDCLTACHKHEPIKTNEKHANRPGYSYTSEACISCHPDGRK